MYSEQCSKFIYGLWIRYICFRRLKHWIYSKDCLFGADKLTKNDDTDINSYSGCSIGFDFRPHFSVPNFDWGKNILVFGKGPKQGLDNTTITAEAEYSINYSRLKKNYVYVFILMKSIFFYFIMPQRYINSK